MGVASTALAADRDSYQDTIGNSSFESARNQYGLTKHMKNGAILHAWMWSFKTITQHMPEIAAAGYTSVQTEPMSKIKEVAANGKKFTENWYYVYQPANTSIGNFVVGTEADLKEMTATAHKYGVRVIVDVVATTSPPIGTPSTPIGRTRTTSTSVPVATAPTARSTIIPTVTR